MVVLTEDIKREIGQHFVFGFHGHEVSDDIRTLICDYHLGHVILMKRNVQSIMQVHDLVRKLQQVAKEAGHVQPLMIGIDQENGLVSAFSSSENHNAGTQFPGAMALAASGSVELAEQVSTASGREMRAVGINWVYSPVADVNSDPRNPVIGVRSFSDDPYEVARYARAVSRGLTKAKIAPSAKHFPGHGNTHVDSHLSLPRIMSNKKSLAALELVPFKGLINDGIATIMTGHMALPLVTGDDTPSSLSKAISTDLIRGDLGFEGVVVTDCLEMEAVAEKYGAEGGAVMALEAGADVVMICHRMDRHVGAFKATYAAVEDGRLSIDKLDASGQRVRALKDAFTGTWNDVLLHDLDAIGVARLKEENSVLSHRAYASIISKIRDPQAMFPILKLGTAVVFTPRMESLNLAVDDAEGKLRDKNGRERNTAGPSYQAFATSVSKRLPMEHVVYAPVEDNLSVDVLAKIRDATVVILATRNAFESGAWQLDYLRKVVQAAKSTPVVLVSTCAPYDLLGLEDVSALCLATFEFTPLALEQAVAVIFGEDLPRGNVPVKLR